VNAETFALIQASKNGIRKNGHPPVPVHLAFTQVMEVEMTYDEAKVGQKEVSSLLKGRAEIFAVGIGKEGGGDCCTNMSPQDIFFCSE
jgi:hypothetical protein